MKTIPHKTERLNALDSLSAFMMMLGVVLHSFITYVRGESCTAWSIRDLNNFNTNLESINSIIIPAFITDWDIAASLKFLFVNITRSIICF